MKMTSSASNLKWFSIVIILITAMTTLAQTTEFTYQGKLADTGTSSATYDFQFRLCATLSADCTAPLALDTQTGVPVVGGSFTAKINFGASVFDGSDRFMEINVRRAGETIYTTLTPRQKLTSAPYSVQSLKATDTLKLGGTAANQFVLTTDSRLNANNYVQNTNTAQPSVNFNVGGTGTANVLNAGTQFNLNGDRVLSNNGTGNLFAGSNAGVNNTGTYNSFFGSGSGTSNVGNSNTAVGASTGRGVVNGANGNSFFGYFAGNYNNSGANNTFIGASANTNQIFSSGDNNTLLGANTTAANGINNSTAIGYRAQATQNNSLVLGGISGVNGATADTRVGIGTTALSFKLQIVDPSNTGLRVQTNTAGGTVASFGEKGVFQIDGVNTAGGRLNILENGNVGIGATNPTQKLDILSDNSDVLAVRSPAPTINLYDTRNSDQPAQIQNVLGNLYLKSSFNNGNGSAVIIDNVGNIQLNDSVSGKKVFTGILRFRTPTSPGATSVCMVSASDTTLTNCSSSLRYKTGLQPFTGGMNVIKHLQPITFKWKHDGAADLGFGAEPVSEIEPLLVTHNQNGEVEGVKYDRLSTVFVNAFKEQQTQIETQAAQINRQQKQIDELKKLVCAMKPGAEICREN